MAIELKVPSAGESITEVVIVEWLRGEGAFAKKDEPVALIETDKANVEVMAPADGVVERVMKQPGERARVGETIALFAPGGAPSEQKENAPGSVPPPPPAKVDPPPPQPTGNVVVTTPTAVTTSERPQPSPRAETRATPGPAQQAAPAAAPQRPEAPPAPAPEAPPAPQPIAEEHLTPSQRRATREGNGHAPAPATAVQRAKAPAAPRTLRPGERAVPMTPLRKRLAERLLEAQQSAALLTTFNEVDMSAVMALRKQYADPFKEKHGVKLGFMSFFVKATVEALKAFPAINAEIHGDDIIYRDFADIGVAVGGGKGLVVPIIRNAEKRSFAELEKQIADFGERAKTGRLKVEELQGGTFTISNGGVYGSLMSTPIVNPPQSGILGMHAIQERPIAKGGAVVIAPMMYVALTYDHRIVDGREAVSFLVRIKEGIENPARLLLEV